MPLAGRLRQSSPVPAPTSDASPSGPADPSSREYLRLVALSAAIGIPAALLAALFLALVHVVEGWLWDDLPKALD
jgi:hypothetical protein